MKYINADLLQEKIKELITESNSRQVNLEAIHQEGADVVESPIRAILKSLLSFIDFLQQDQLEMDLDKEVHRFFEECIEVYEVPLYGKVKERVINVDCYELTARHFFELGKNSK